MTLRAKLLRTVGSMVAVRREDGRHGDFSIAKTVLRLAEQLGLATTAEGIETEEQRKNWLRWAATMDKDSFFPDRSPRNSLKPSSTRNNLRHTVDGANTGKIAAGAGATAASGQRHTQKTAPISHALSGSAPANRVFLPIDHPTELPT